MRIRLLTTVLTALLIIPTIANDSLSAPQQPAAQAARSMTPEQIIEAFRRPENSTGNIADAVEAATGARGWMSADMKPISDGKIVGRAWTAVMRPVLKSDTRTYPTTCCRSSTRRPPAACSCTSWRAALEIAAHGQPDGDHRAGARPRGDRHRRRRARRHRAAAIGHQVFARRVSPATSVGRMVSVAKQTPVTCAEVLVQARRLHRRRHGWRGGRAGSKRRKRWSRC